jgi:hypothetical protein
MANNAAVNPVNRAFEAAFLAPLALIMFAPGYLAIADAFGGMLGMWKKSWFIEPVFIPLLKILVHPGPVSSFGLVWAACWATSMVAFAATYIYLKRRKTT